MTLDKTKQKLKIPINVSDVPLGTTEELSVVAANRNSFVALRSPGWIQGLAKGDEFVLDTNNPCGFKVVKRSGMLCIQYFVFSHDLDGARAYFALALGDLSRFEDGIVYQVGDRTALLVFSIPVELGFTKIETIFNGGAKKFIGSKWYYGNVYDPRDGKTPLNWWL